MNNPKKYALGWKTLEQMMPKHDELRHHNGLWGNAKEPAYHPPFYSIQAYTRTTSPIGCGAPQKSTDYTWAQLSLLRLLCLTGRRKLFPPLFCHKGKYAWVTMGTDPMDDEVREGEAFGLERYH